MLRRIDIDVRRSPATRHSSASVRLRCCGADSTTRCECCVTGVSSTRMARASCISAFPAVDCRGDHNSARYPPTKGSTMGDLRAETSHKTKRRHFITGASSGIGAAVAAALHARGDELWLLARSNERAHELWQRFPDAEILVADLANPFALEIALLSAVLPSLLNCLLHIAGVIDF